MRLFRRVLRGLLMTILALLCAALLYVLVIMGDPSQEAETRAGQSRAALPSMPQSQMHFEPGSLYQAEYYFTAQLLVLPDSSPYRLSSITVQETKPRGAGATVREVRLTYQDPATTSTVHVSSLTPARYLRSLPDRGLLIAADQTISLAGSRAVFMSDGKVLHLHVQDGDFIYQIEGDISTDEMRRVAASAMLQKAEE